MPQEQRVVAVLFMNYQEGTAQATGNNATWQCCCPQGNRLIGRSGFVDRVTPGYTVECPGCGRQYAVVPNGRDRGAVKEVREI